MGTTLIGVSMRIVVTSVARWRLVLAGLFGGVRIIAHSGDSLMDVLNMRNCVREKKNGKGFLGIGHGIFEWREGLGNPAVSRKIYNLGK